MDGECEYITVTGTVSAIVFQNDDNGYAVLRLDTGDGVVTAAGCIPGVSPGEKLRLTGAWKTHQSYGEQFKTEGFEIIAPTGADEIYKYLASGAIKGIGPGKAREIVKKFGDMTLSVIENEPEKLSRVKGITIVKARQIGASLRRQAALKRLMDFLSKFGIKPVVSTRIYKDYGNLSLEAVRENPYIIAGEPYGAEFSEADRVALGIGFESDCPERVSAAVLFELAHNLQNGHVFIPQEKLIYATCALISVERESVEAALAALCEEGEVIQESVAGEQACYLRRMYKAELYISERLLEMLRSSGKKPIEMPVLLGKVEREQGITYAKAQRGALELAAKYTVMALTGGPGTGKTTTVRGILALFDALGHKTALCAPTGRAAKRLGETCRREAVTIHRLLGTSPGKNGGLVFSHDELNPINADAVIVDEASMVDVPLMRALLGAMKRGCRLVMVGDADQLPPVGPGSVFADVIKSEAVPTAALSEIFRQARNSGIVKNAHLVNKGVVPELENSEDFFFLRRTGDEQIAQTIAELFGHRLPKNMGIDPSQIQVLSPTRRQRAGTAALNERLREAVNPQSVLKKEKRYGEFLFRAGDKVMQIRNNYDIMWKKPEGTGVFNGDVGMITEIDTHRETVTVDFEDKLVVYQYEQLSELEPAFAMTVHKSQGSEYNAVILAVTAGAPQLLTRSILYTAMTRAKNLLILVGEPGVMAKMVENDRKQRRYGGLRYRLSQQGEPRL